MRIAGAPTLGEQVVNARAFAFVVGADESEGFVEEKEQTVRVVERFAVDEHVGRRDFAGGVADGQTADGDGVFFEKRARFTAGAVAEVGEELVEAAHGGAVNVRGRGGTKHFAPGERFHA